MKIGILGGSFNPPHLGHLIIAMQVRTALQLDEIWLMPCFKLQKGFEKEFASVEDRFAMVKMLENAYIKVSDYEITTNQRSYSIDTLEGLEKAYPDDSFFWITGSDQLESFQKYYRWEDLVLRQNLVIFPREYLLPHLVEKVKETLLLREIPSTLTILQSESLVLSNISSTRIRKRILEGLPIHFLVPEKVEKYILRKSLYNGIE